jgi:hypothetical protein
MNLGFIHKLLPATIAFALLIPACTERIDIELDSTYARLVVDGKVSSDSVKHYVILSVSSDYFSNQAAPRVQNALVELSFDDVSLQLSEIPGEPGRYETPHAFRGQIGTTYELDISHVDIDQDGETESYHASSTMPGGPELEKIELKYYPTPVSSGYTVFMYASHPPEQRDWFGFKLYKNSDILTDSLDKYAVLSDELFDTGYIPGIPVAFLSDDDPREAVNTGDTIGLELHCIEQAYYDFVTEAQLEIAGYYPLFSGPPSNVSSNIKNGALGLFTAYSIQRYALLVQEQKK